MAHDSEQTRIYCKNIVNEATKKARRLIKDTYPISFLFRAFPVPQEIRDELEAIGVTNLLDIKIVRTCA